MWVHASKLPELHKLRNKKGYMRRMEVAPSYLSVIREVTQGEHSVKQKRL